MSNNLKKIQKYGQSIWLDLLDRNLMDSGNLQRMIEEDGLRGLTSNPAIFEKAITGSKDYDKDIAEIKKKGGNELEVFFELAIKDIQRAADIFRPVYDSTDGRDGFVSLEVSPDMARDTEGTIAQARELWERLDRKNVMIKIPGTIEGLPAIRKCISEGINVNVTLLFGLERYREVAKAYMAGLEDRLEAGFSIDRVSSVASFFLSRIDVMVDPMLKERGLEELKGKTAIASAKKAYAIYEEEFGKGRFQKLEAEGATRQRLLWASTGTKDPSFRDVKYVEALIGENTINTLPIDTLEAFRDHGNAVDTLNSDSEKATDILKKLAQEGIDLDRITQDLEDEGIEKFNGPFEKLLKGIQDQG